MRLHSMSVDMFIAINVRVWPAENPRAYVEYERNTSKVNVRYNLMHDKVIGLLFFAEPTVTSNIYPDMLLHAVPQFPEGVIFTQDGTPPYYGNIAREFLDTTFPQRWIGRGAVMAWPTRSPGLTPLDFL
ncbi:hypothetical protein AVEN_93055-1 [Araneus ventricosus]|uniref:Tc1-like transposase DDE domain-containing protein n=1 Tax=Araneus ventricosus TaxID=182803 RepID=A0A4Y2PXE1_ARAVE|nr:hypothetical protein AVEN_93055-1 [Araneus ventricosus]